MRPLLVLFSGADYTKPRVNWQPVSTYYQGVDPRPVQLNQVCYPYVRRNFSHRKRQKYGSKTDGLFGSWIQPGGEGD